MERFRSAQPQNGSSAVGNPHGIRTYLLWRVLQPDLMVFRRQVEMRLGQNDGGFFAGGSEPTAADFMMIFPLELWAKKFPETFGQKCREYVERIHERYAPQILSVTLI